MRERERERERERDIISHVHLSNPSKHDQSNLFWLKEFISKGYSKEGCRFYKPILHFKIPEIIIEPPINRVKSSNHLKFY